MPSTDGSALADLLHWADDLGLHRLGPPDSVRERPWSTVVRVTTTDGPLWLKAAGPGSRYESALLATLTRHSAPHTVLPLAVAEDRGLSLLPHAGEVLRATPMSTVDTWERLLAEHAQLQRALEPAVPELLAGGVPDQRPEAMPDHVDRLLEDPPEGLQTSALKRLRAIAPAYRRACSQLAAFAIPPTLQHDDLHDGNVLVDDQGGYRVTDWGDAAVAHPFGVLLVTLNVLTDRLSGTPDEGAVARLRDAYLEHWTDLLPLPDLRAAAELSMHVGRVGRCLSWQRALVAATDVPEEFATAPAAWLADLLDGAPTTDESAGQQPDEL
jgi:hypothetical protein